MGLPNFMKLAQFAIDTQNGVGAARGFQSPATIGADLADAIAGDVFGVAIAEDPTSPVTRAMAMRQPAVVRSRGVILTLCRYPFVAYRAGRKLNSAPAWLTRTDTDTSPQERFTWLMDDVFFHNRALLFVERAKYPSGEILDGVRIPPQNWRDRPEAQGGGVEIEISEGTWAPFTRDQGVYLRFNGFQDGFLKIGATVVRTGEGIQLGIAGRAKSPIPMIDLHITDNVQMTTPEKTALRDQWVAARNDPNGAVAITPFNLEANVLGEGDDGFLNNARNSQRIDVANLAQVPVGLIDGTTSMASLTYSTQEGRRVEFHDYGLNLWRTVFEARLSQDDVTPKGTRIEIDLSELMEVPDEGSGPELED